MLKSRKGSADWGAGRRGGGRLGTLAVQIMGLGTVGVSLYWAKYGWPGHNSIKAQLSLNVCN